MHAAFLFSAKSTILGATNGVARVKISGLKFVFDLRQNFRN